MTFFSLIFPGNVDILGPFPTWKFQSELSSLFVHLYRRIIILEGLINLLIIFFNQSSVSVRHLHCLVLRTGAICDASYCRAQTHPEHLLLLSVALLQFSK